jgi:hypothetical protein
MTTEPSSASSSSESTPSIESDRTYVLELELAEQFDLSGSISSNSTTSSVIDDVPELTAVSILPQGRYTTSTMETTVPTTIPTPTTSTSTPTPAVNALELRGIQYSRRISRKAPNESDDVVMHKKQDRASLTPDVLNKLLKDATSLKHKKYDYVPMILNDEDGLDDTYNLDVLINKTYREHCAFDLHDVFTIIIPLYPEDEDNDEVERTLDLYTQYADISIEDVARSNSYYREWLLDPWFEENLRLTYTFFQNNVTDDLFLKVSETYDKYPRSERGGPLFFILMLNQLLADTEEAAASLQKRVKDFKISNIEGENIRKVVSLLRGAVTRLTYIKKIPEDFPKILLQVMQTSSVDSFNETFHLIEKQRKHRTVLRRTGRHDPDISVNDIFLFAEAEYRDSSLKVSGPVLLIPAPNPFSVPLETPLGPPLVSTVAAPILTRNVPSLKIRLVSWLTSRSSAQPKPFVKPIVVARRRRLRAVAARRRTLAFFDHLPKRKTISVLSTVSPWSGAPNS